MELISEVISSKMFGNIVILITSIIGVGGSLLIYRKKRIDQREILRSSLIAELKDMEKFLEERNSSKPALDFIQTKVFDSNADNLGLLSEEEAEGLVTTYNKATIVDEFRKNIIENDPQDWENIFRRIDTNKGSETILDDYESWVEGLEKDIKDVREKLDENNKEGLLSKIKKIKA